MFKLEYGLGYTEDVIEETDDMDGLAKAVCGQLSGSCGNKKQEDVFGSLQEVYHQNRGFLLDYQITLSSLFEDLNDENSFLDMSAKRIDISAKYRGTAVKFKELHCSCISRKLPCFLNLGTEMQRNFVYFFRTHDFGILLQ